MERINIMLVFLGIIVVFILGVVLQLLQSVLLPFVIAILFSIIFEPVVLFLKRKRVPTAVSLLVVVLSFALVLFLLALLVTSSVGSFATALPAYEAKFERVAKGAEELVNKTAQQLNVRVEDIKLSDIISFSTVSSVLATGVGSFINFMGNAFMILLFMLFILAGSGELVTKVERAFPPDDARRIATVLKNISEQVRQYLITKTLVSAITGALISLVLWVLGVDFPLLWGFLAFLLNYIPNIGSIVAVIFPLVVSLLQFDTLTRPILVVILLIVIQNVMGNVIEPKMMAERLNLSAILILISLIFWGWLWGIWGMLLSVPLTATIKIVFENIEPLRFLSVLMSGHLKPLPIPKE